VRGSLKIFAKDVFELLASPRTIFLAVVLPSVLLLLMGQLRVNPPSFRMLVAGRPDKTDSRARADFDKVLRLLGEVSRLEVETEPVPAVDPLTVMNRRGFDLVLNVGDLDTKRWAMYTAETEPARLRPLQDLVTGIQRAIALIQKAEAPEPKIPPAPPGTPPDPPTAVSSEPEGDAGNEAVALVEQLEAAGSFPVRSLFVYFPRAASRSDGLLPLVIALVVCFVPFVLTAPTLIEEKQQHTFEVLLAAPNVSPIALFTGKSLLPVAVALFDFAVMLALAQSVYHLDVKAGLVSMTLVLLPALFSSAFLGLAFSAVATSQPQAMIASAVYFLAIALFSGLITPINEASAFLQAFSKLFPLTFAYPPLTAWMFGAARTPHLLASTVWLLAQAGIYLLIAILAFRRQLRLI
jgi:ABC-type multidrug transport system permease subunit